MGLTDFKYLNISADERNKKLIWIPMKQLKIDGIMNNQRDLIIDFFRGVIIINMIMVHFSSKFPKTLEAIINFADFAIEGFVFLAGFMIGRHYLEKFKKNKNEVIRRLLQRAAKLILIQYIMILTISLPFYSIFKLNNNYELLNFILSSFLFLNQIPVIHILPTFIPLLITSPLILLMLVDNWNYLLILFSFMLFLLGCYDPYIFSLGDKTIFPVVLWQIYFVVGIYFGKLSGSVNNINHNKLLVYAVIIYSFAFLMKYGGYFNEIHIIKEKFNIYPKKFSLNIYGLIYGASFLFLFYTGTIRLWGILKRHYFFSEIVPLLGRNSLITFVIHAYFVYLIESFNNLKLNKYVIYVLIVTSFYFTYKIIEQINERNRTGRLPLAYKWLFC